MGKFIKLLIILAAVTGLFMYYPNIAGYETDPQPSQQAETTQMPEKENSVSEYQQTESTLMTILPYLPERNTWPDPLQKCLCSLLLKTRLRNVLPVWNGRHCPIYRQLCSRHW